VSDIRQPDVRHRGRQPIPLHNPPLLVLQLEHGRGLRLVGELDLATIGLLVAELEMLPAGADVLDLTELTFMDASGLHALERYAATLDGTGPLVLENAPPHVHRLFDLTGASRNPAIELRRGAARG
jgi:anti-anti-sigma factor